MGGFAQVWDNDKDAAYDRISLTELASAQDPGLGDTCRFPWETLAPIYKNLYSPWVSDAKPIEFRGTSLDDLRAFPSDARREAGYQLDLVQGGRDPDDWKPMNTVGAGVREIRIRDAAGAFRVIYLAKLADAVYVLHCFQKKTEKTSKRDLDLATRRFRDLMQELKP